MPVLGEVGEATTPPPCPNPALHRCWPSRAFGWALGVALLYVLYLQSSLTSARAQAAMNTELWSMEEVARWKRTDERLTLLSGEVTAYAAQVKGLTRLTAPSCPPPPQRRRWRLWR